MHTYIHTYIHTYMHTCIHTYIRTCMHICIYEPRHALAIPALAHANFNSQRVEHDSAELAWTQLQSFSKRIN